MSYSQDIDREIKERLPHATDDEVSSITKYVKLQVLEVFQDGIETGRLSGIGKLR